MKAENLRVKYLDPKDYSTYTDEASGENINLILMSGIRKIIKNKKFSYTIDMEACNSMTVKGKDGFHIIIKCTATDPKGKVVETYASASPLTTSSNYTVEMAEKRSISRAILMLADMYDSYKGADEFSSTPKSLKLPIK
jgi:hypothetical protein